MARLLVRVGLVCACLALLSVLPVSAQNTVTIVTGGVTAYLVSPNLFWSFGLCRFSTSSNDRVPCVTNGRIVSQFLVIGKRACSSGSYGVDLLNQIEGLTVTNDVINTTLTLSQPRIPPGSRPQTDVTFAYIANGVQSSFTGTISKFISGIIIENDGALKLLESHTATHIGWQEGVDGHDAFDVDLWNSLGYHPPCGMTVVLTPYVREMNSTFQGGYLYQQRGNVSDSTRVILDSVYNSGQTKIEYSRAVTQTRISRAEYSASSTSAETFGLGLEVGFSYEWGVDGIEKTTISASVKEKYENSISSTKAATRTNETTTTTIVNLAVDIPPGVEMRLIQEQVYIKSNYGSNTVLTYCYPDWGQCKWINQKVAPPIDIMQSFPQFRFEMR